MADLYPQLLQKKVSILIYSGLMDGTDSNFMGTDRWLAALPWSKEHHWVDAPTCLWRVQNKIAGYVRKVDGLTQVKIRNAGHLAPADQPHVMLDLLDRSIYFKLFC